MVKVNKLDNIAWSLIGILIVGTMIYFFVFYLYKTFIGFEYEYSYKNSKDLFDKTTEFEVSQLSAIIIMRSTNIDFEIGPQTNFQEISLSIETSSNCPIIEGRLIENVFYYDLGFLFDKTEYSREDTEECISEMLVDSKKALDDHLQKINNDLKNSVINRTSWDN